MWGRPRMKNGLGGWFIYWLTEWRRDIQALHLLSDAGADRLGGWKMHKAACWLSGWLVFNRGVTWCAEDPILWAEIPLGNQQGLHWWENLPGEEIQIPLLFSLLCRTMRTRCRMWQSIALCSWVKGQRNQLCTWCRGEVKNWDRNCNHTVMPLHNQCRLFIRGLKGLTSDTLEDLRTVSASHWGLVTD